MLSKLRMEKGWLYRVKVEKFSRGILSIMGSFLWFKEFVGFEVIFIMIFSLVLVRRGVTKIKKILKVSRFSRKEV